MDEQYPRGKLTETDEGALKIRIGTDDKTKTIIIDFGKQIVWVGMDATTARTFARNILRRCDQIEGKRK